MPNDNRSIPPVKARLVPALERAVALMDYVTASPTPPTLSELARALTLPKSSVHGLCQTLCALRLLRIRAGGFALGPHALQWSQAFLAGTDVVAEFHALMAEDRRLDSHTVILSHLDGNDVTYLACRNSASPLGISFRIGMRLAAVFTATGKALLAALDTKTCSAALPKTWPKRLTPRSVRSRSAFLADLAATRERGYSIDDGEVREGMLCLGVAIIGREGDPVAGMAISLTTAEATPEVISRTGAILVEIGAELSRRL
jgi:IclR family transcriptional regulator, blcABC operon repressor